MSTRFRTGPAVISLAAASLFVLFRVLYKIVFGGVVTGSHFLPSLPQVRLPGPFSHISLFGPITLEGLWATALGALPFALLILVFGLAVSFLNVPKLTKVFTSQQSPAFLRATAIALATLPKLIAQSGQILATSKLRTGLGVRYLLVPVLGSALERALSLATNLELRHGKPKITLGPLSIRANELFVDEIYFGNLDFSQTGTVFITGPNGSGKSSLLRALAGLSLTDGRKLRGTIEISSPVGTKALGYLPQDPRLGFMGETIEEERELCEVENLSGDWNPSQKLSTLSEGQAKLFALDLILSTNPSILLLDEPFDGLDDFECAKLELKLAAVSSKSLILITAPNLQASERLAVQVWQLSDRGLQPGEFQYRAIQKTGNYPPPRNDVTLSISGLSAFAGDAPLFENQSIELTAGSITSIAGVNGVGKTSLLSLLVSNESKLVPENFQDLFVTDSLASELQLSDRLSKSESGLTKATFFSLLNGAENQNVDSLLTTHPRDLSFATSLALAISIQVVQKPKLLLLDEPGKGFDPVAKAATIEALKCVAETGTAVLFATHDSLFVSAAHKQFLIQNREIQEVTFESAKN